MGYIIKQWKLVNNGNYGNLQKIESLQEKLGIILFLTEKLNMQRNPWGAKKTLRTTNPNVL